MGVILIILLLITPLFLRAQEAWERVGSFFQREGYVVKVEANRVIIDLGRDKVRAGEEFDVFKEGKEIVHPVTKQVIGKEKERVGRIRIEEALEGFSYARILEGQAKEGDRIKLRAERVCFEGKEETFFRIKALVPDLKKDQPCDYVVREISDGIGIEYKGTPVAFYKSLIPQGEAIKRASLEDINLLGRSRLLLSLPGLPISADICDLTGTGKEFLVILFPERISVYELIRRDIAKRFDYSLPAGVAIGLQCGKIGQENQDYVLVNMISGNSASSLILKPMGDSFIPVVRNLPYLMGILDKERARETFVGQRFDLRNKFGQAIRLSLERDALREQGAFLAPRGFRVDSAFYFGNYLIFTDSTGRVRVFKGDGEVFSTEEGFGGSYSHIDIPLEQGKMSSVFNPKGAKVSFLNFSMAFVIKNHTGVVQRFLDILKYTRGEIFILGEKREDLLFMKQLRGANFEEAIQAILTTKDGRVLVITGRTGTLSIQNRGDVYELELRSL